MIPPAPPAHPDGVALHYPMLLSRDLCGFKGLEPQTHGDSWGYYFGCTLHQLYHAVRLDDLLFAMGTVTLIDRDMIERHRDREIERDT